jgi:hypothetical protein
MEVEVARHLQFRSLYQACNAASGLLNPDWGLVSLRELYRMDREEWKDDHVCLHEQTLDYALQTLKVMFPRIVLEAVTLVTQTQASYWRHQDPMFFDLCRSQEILRPLRKLERRSRRKNDWRTSLAVQRPLQTPKLGCRAAVL